MSKELLLVVSLSVIRIWVSTIIGIISVTEVSHRCRPRATSKGLEIVT